jgi:transposase-like protein
MRHYTRCPKQPTSPRRSWDKQGQCSWACALSLRACHKTFNALSGTPLARLRHRARWAEYAQASSTVREAARRCGVHKNTAFRWRHRFLARPARSKPLHLHGIVEADETYFLESHKGERHLPRPPRKRGLSHEQIPVLIARNRPRCAVLLRRQRHLPGLCQTDPYRPPADQPSVQVVVSWVTLFTSRTSMPTTAASRDEWLVSTVSPPSICPTVRDGAAARIASPRPSHPHSSWPTRRGAPNT